MSVRSRLNNRSSSDPTIRYDQGKIRGRARIVASRYFRDNDFAVEVQMESSAGLGQLVAENNAASPRAKKSRASPAFEQSWLGDTTKLSEDKVDYDTIPTLVLTGGTIVVAVDPRDPTLSPPLVFFICLVVSFFSDFFFSIPIIYLRRLCAFFKKPCALRGPGFLFSSLVCVL
ncbi:MAG TPA: hypothetical protein VJX23_01955 [Candidatus Binataceae bacterium]|nr:hypothetical protein [Candidatus Binataceae bacterium]